VADFANQNLSELDLRVDFVFLQRFSRWVYSNWPVK